MQSKWANVLWERTAGHFTPHYPKTLLLSGDRLVGEEDARVDHLVVFLRLAAHGLIICWSLEWTFWWRFQIEFPRKNASK
jgi:hypothetical protein